MTTYKEFHARSIRDPEGFWGEQAKLIDWHRPFDKVLDYAKPPFRSWFAGRPHEPLPQRRGPPPRRAREPEGAGVDLHRGERGEELDLRRSSTTR